jgi:hypothetical protein
MTSMQTSESCWIGNEQLLGTQLTVLQRSKHTGEAFWVSDALVRKAPPVLVRKLPPEISFPVRIAPPCELAPVALEIAWTAQGGKSDEACLQELFDKGHEILGEDDEFATAIRFVRGSDGN